MIGLPVLGAIPAGARRSLMQLELRDYFNVLLQTLVDHSAGGHSARRPRGLGYSLVQTPIYQAQVQMEAMPNRPDNGLIEFLRKNLTSYITGLTRVDFINSVLTANRGIRRCEHRQVLGRDESRRPSPTTMLILLTVDDMDPARGGDAGQCAGRCLCAQEERRGPATRAIRRSSCKKSTPRGPRLARDARTSS